MLNWNARRWMLLPLVLVALLAHPPAPAAAHPLGNFTINRYSRLEIDSQHMRLVYVLDKAEIPTFQALPAIDRDGDGTLADNEQEAYRVALVAELMHQLTLELNGAPLALTPGTATLEFPPGQGGLKTLRLQLEASTTLPASIGTGMVRYHDGNFPERLGWREVVVQPLNNVQLLESSVPTQDISQELRNYPQDLLQSPPTVDGANFRFQLAPGAAPQNAAAAPRVSSQASPQQDQLTALVNTPASQPLALLVALALAFGLGAAHAMAPGHGKAIVAAYLVGARGTSVHALFLGLTTTVTHTAGVFGLGLVTLFVSRFILPEQLFPWLGVISGLLVIVVGLTLLRGRLHHLRSTSVTHTHGELDANGGHDHGGGYHVHQPQTSALTWRSLLALGVSGGLLPCPSALVLLLSAIALGRVGLGLLLIVAFSLGLASVLTGIGLLLVHARRFFERLPVRNRVLRLVPLASACVVAIAGVGITVQALTQL
ncbi:MAG: sulfite exporter TauE/SafE family protein [Chloroflexaceae bacterium]|nr:sulfite exporter TauE/SafE family protein [Chloroflexaceae bacterium]